jgi:hypothetical protein
MKDMKVTFSDTTRDYSTWLHEKNRSVLRSLCALLRDIPSVKENASFLVALSEALKVYALCNENLNGIYCKLVYDFLVEYNIEGYFYLQDLVHGTEGSSIMEDIMQNKRDEEILVLIAENKKENRGAIAERLARMPKLNSWATKVAADIECVHNGERTWNWFYDKHWNDASTFKLHFSKTAYRDLYDYFQSVDYMTADDAAGLTIEKTL